MLLRVILFGLAMLAGLRNASAQDSTHANPDTLITVDSVQHQPEPRPSRVRAYYPSKEAQDAARKSLNRLYVPGLTLNDHSAQQAHKDRGHYLRAAGYHWLISLGLGATGTAVGYFSDWESGVSRGAVVGLYIGAVVMHVRVPIDLILAGSAKK